LAETIRERLIEAAPVNAALTGTASPWNVPTQLDTNSQDRGVFRTTGTVRLYIPLADHVDLDVERSRLSAKLREAKGEVKRLEQKLGNEQFRSKAPAEVVAREGEKLAAARSRVDGLRRRLAELG